MINEDETTSEPTAETPQPEQPAPTMDAPSTEPTPDTPPGEGAPVAAGAPAAAGEGGPDGGPDRGGDRRGGRRHFGRRRVCTFCIDKARSIDYKDPGKLRRYLSDRARIEPRRKTGTCAKHQRWLAEALKRARHLALLPYTPEHIRVSGLFASRR
jgi:small subunit ribosomal protein S18